MKRSTVIFFFAVVVIVAVIARCNSRSRLAEERTETATPASLLVPSAAPSASVTATASPTASAQPTKTPGGDIGKAAAQIQPAVVSISVFEPSGKLLRTGSGVFISSNGRILTTRSLMEGSAHAIARTADNRIHNIDGILADSESEDLAVLQMEVKDSVPFVAPNPGVDVDEAARVAVVGAPLGREKTATVEGSISKKHRGRTTDWLELSTPVSSQSMGAPVVNSRGDLVGLVTHGPGNPAVVVRTSTAINAVVTEIPDSPKSKWLAEVTPPSPAEGPLQKIPLAQSPQAQKSKLIYSPAPAYPSSARSASGNLRGTGRFRLTFDANGQVKNIMILHSTQNGALDQAAIEALRRWKAAPGQEWTLNVPITFQ